MICINNKLTSSQQEKANAFLDKVKALLPTNEFTVEQTFKNKEFAREYSFRNRDYKKVLLSLTKEDCISIESNDNPRYEDAEVYKFIKNTELNVFGEIEKLDIYIKMYIREYDSYNIVIIISFHKEGVFD